MNKWEYCSFCCDEMQEFGYLTRSNATGMFTEEINPGPREDFLKFKLKVLASLGLEGWELCGTTVLTRQGETFYLKRALSAS